MNFYQFVTANGGILMSTSIFLFLLVALLFLCCFIYAHISGKLKRAHVIKMAELGYEQVSETVSKDNGEGGESWQQFTVWRKVRAQSLIDANVEEAVRTMERTVTVIDAACAGMPNDGLWKTLGNRSVELKKSVEILKA